MRRRILPFLPAASLVLSVAAVSVSMGRSTEAATPAAPQRGSLGNTVGPDVTVIRLPGVRNWGADGSVRGYSVATDSCNVGNAPVNWCDDGSCVASVGGTQKHPVIAQNLYRFEDGRFEQIGMSWLKHGFFSLNTPDSGCVGTDASGNPFSGCISPSTGGNQLGVGCTDLYSASLNGSQPLGRRSEVNAATGLFPFPPTGGGANGAAGQRIRVDESELGNPNARFFVEGHYVVDNDALAGNGLNNASYREVSVDAAFNLGLVGATVRERAAIYAWQALDPEVEIVTADLRGSVLERFHAARRISDLGGGVWHYEYAIHNMNSDRAARSFEVAFPGATSITNVGFHAVDHHSGEPYAIADWGAAVSTSAGTVRWQTDDFATDPNANALRWGTMFSFRFDANRPPDDSLHTLGLFKPAEDTGLLRIGFASTRFSIFVDGFEAGSTSAWSSTVP